MAFHEHGFADRSLVLRQCQLDRHDGLCQCKHFVNAHVDCRQPQQPLQFLVNFQGDEADAYMRLYSFTCKMEHRSDLNLGFCYAEGFLHMP